MKVKKGKVMKVLMVIVVVVSISFINIHHPLASSDYVNYFGVEMTDDEYDTLLNLGFTEDEIYYMLEKTFEENKDLDATLLATNIKYYKTVVPTYGMSYSVEVTQAEYLNQGNAQVLGTLYTYYRQEVTTITANGSDKYRYKLSTIWLNWPSVASYDIMGIGFVNSVYISNNNPYFNYTYAGSDGNYITSTVFYDKKKTSTGGSVVYLMPSNVISLSSNLYFDVKKNTNDTLTSLSMCGDYAHAIVPVTSTQAADHTIGYGGIVHGSGLSASYDATGCCYASITGISW